MKDIIKFSLNIVKYIFLKNNELKILLKKCM